MDDISLISVDLKPMADVTNNIINKLSQSIGWAVVPRKSKKEMEVAVETYIKEIQEDDSLPPIVRAAKICNARKEIKEYVNLQDILQHAQEFGNEYEKNDEELDEDWAMFFYDKARNVSRDDAKVLWGKILAKECNQSDSIPKILIHILSIMSQKNAEAFEKLCSFIMQEVDHNGNTFDILFVYASNNKLFRDIGLSYEMIRDLEALGLINNCLDLIYGNGDNNKILKFRYFELNIEIYPQANHGQYTIPCGQYVLTEAGLILSTLIKRKKLEEFKEYIEKFLLYEKIEFKIN